MDFNRNLSIDNEGFYFTVADSWCKLAQSLADRNCMEDVFYLADIAVDQHVKQSIIHACFGCKLETSSIVRGVTDTDLDCTKITCAFIIEPESEACWSESNECA